MQVSQANEDHAGKDYLIPQVAIKYVHVKCYSSIFDFCIYTCPIVVIDTLVTLPHKVLPSIITLETSAHYGFGTRQYSNLL